MNKNIILEHELVPNHEILEKEQAQAILKLYGITADQLPKIKETDAAAKAIGAKRGNILKITRKSQTAGESIYYRTVV